MDVMRGPSLLNDGDGDGDEQHSNVLRDTCKRILYSLAGCMHVGGWYHSDDERYSGALRDTHMILKLLHRYCVHTYIMLYIGAVFWGLLASESCIRLWAACLNVLRWGRVTIPP